VKYHCLERTLDITYGCTTVRLWVNLRGLPSPKELYQFDILVPQVTQLIRDFHDATYMLSERLSEIENINAFQIVHECADGTRRGLMFYTVPF
jgi:hypothetical protein